MGNIKQKLIISLDQTSRDEIEKGLVKYGKIKVVGLGIFETRKIAARRGRNPQTSEIVMIPSYTKVKFRPTKSLKTAVCKI